MTKSLEDYLEMIHLLLAQGNRARVSDVAAGLGVKMPSVIRAVTELKKMGLVTQKPYAGIELTEQGRTCAEEILDRHTLLRLFLEKLGVSVTTADNDACLMEHILSAETLERIRAFVRKI